MTTATEKLSDYAQAVEDNLGDLEHVSTGVCPACPDCQRDHGMEPRAFYAACENGDMADAPHFSWHHCQACGTSLGGDRHVAHGIDTNGDLNHFDVCEDCLQYLNYGDEPERWGWDDKGGNDDEWPEPPAQNYRD